MEKTRFYFIVFAFFPAACVILIFIDLLFLKKVKYFCSFLCFLSHFHFLHSFLSKFSFLFFPQLFFCLWAKFHSTMHHRNSEKSSEKRFLDTTKSCFFKTCTVCFLFPLSFFWNKSHQKQPKTFENMRRKLQKTIFLLPRFLAELKRLQFQDKTFQSHRLSRPISFFFRSKFPKNFSPYHWEEKGITISWRKSGWQSLKLEQYSVIAVILITLLNTVCT